MGQWVSVIEHLVALQLGAEVSTHLAGRFMFQIKQHSLPLQLNREKRHLVALQLGGEVGAYSQKLDLNKYTVIL